MRFTVQDVILYSVKHATFQSAITVGLIVPRIKKLIANKMAKVALGEYGEPLVPESRLEKVFYQLQRNVRFPDGMEFATQRQEPIHGDNGGFQGPLAVFYITSPHPNKNKRALLPEKVVSIAQMPYNTWVMAEKEQRHYAFLADPLRPIFAGLLRRHLQKITELKELD